MKEVARIGLPPHPPDGGFDHAAVDPVGERLYVAHPTNDSVEVIDLPARRFAGSLRNLRGVAGVWVDPTSRRLFTSNRGEDTASIFRLEGGRATEVFRCPTGVRPNGLAFDPRQSLLMVAGVGNPQVADARPTLTFVHTETGRRRAQLEVPGRTRWAIYHPASNSFYVNIAHPPSIVVVKSTDVTSVARSIPVNAQGPHGLEQDPDGRRLYCACDDGTLVEVDPVLGTVRAVAALSGPPDVLWLSRDRSRLYCAVGEPGCVDVFDLDPVRPAERVSTGPDAHTITLDERRGELHVFLPESHEDLVFQDAVR